MAENLLGQPSTPPQQTFEADLSQLAPPLTETTDTTLLPPLRLKLRQIIQQANCSMGILFELNTQDQPPHAIMIAHDGLSLAYTGAFSHFPLTDKQFPLHKLLEKPLLISNLPQANKHHHYTLLHSLQDEGAGSVMGGGLPPAKNNKPLILLVASTQSQALHAKLWQTTLSLAKDLPPLIHTQAAQSDSRLQSHNLNSVSELDADTKPLITQQESDLEQLLAAMMEAEEEVQRHNNDLATLNAIFEVINRTLNLDKILEYVVSRTLQILNINAVWIYLVDQTSSETPLELKIHRGLSTKYIRGRRRINFGADIEGLVAAEGRALYINNLPEYSGRYHFLMEQENFNAIAAVPLTCVEERNGEESTRIVGVLGCATRETHRWLSREARLMTAIANQVGLAINNAQLYAQVQDSIAMLSASNKVLQEINSQLIDSQVQLEQKLSLNNKRYPQSEP
jgi:hypothetical protein